MAFGPLDDVPNSSVRHRVAKIPAPSPGLLSSFLRPRRCPLCWWRETSNGTAPAAPTPGARRARKRGGDPRSDPSRFDAVIESPVLESLSQANDHSCGPRVRPSAQLSFSTKPRASPYLLDIHQGCFLSPPKGMVSKHRDRPYRGGWQKHWIKVKNRKHPAKDRVLDSFR